MKHSMIAVANRTHARLFTADSASAPLVEIQSMVHPEAKMHEQDITSDLPGKSTARSGAGGHSYTDETRIKGHELTVFAKQIAEQLETADNEKAFSHLLLVASPKMLGELRSHLPERIKEKIVFELDKNLTQEEPAEIRAHLPKYLKHD